MTMTASLAVSPSSIVAGPDGAGTAVTYTVSNSDTATVVSVLSLRPYAYRASTQQQAYDVLFDTPTLNPNTQDVPAAGNKTFTVFAKAMFPQAALTGYAGGYIGGVQGTQAINSQSASPSVTYDISAEIICSDGTVLNPTVATLTVTPSPHS